jgi:hypothetical protein
VFPAQAHTGEVGLALGFAEGPEQGDQVNENHGEKLFVAPEVAKELSEFALDTVSDPMVDGQEPAKLRLIPATDI